jgi:hypothetical protein
LGRSNPHCFQFGGTRCIGTKCTILSAPM